jgi:hypothetical protein
LPLARANGQTIRDAARLAGSGGQTATRWLADPTDRRRAAQLWADIVPRAPAKITDGVAYTYAAGAVRALLDTGR